MIATMIMTTAVAIIFSLQRFDPLKRFRAGCPCEDRELCHCFLVDRHLRAEESLRYILLSASPIFTRKGTAQLAAMVKTFPAASPGQAPRCLGVCAGLPARLRAPRSQPHALPPAAVPASVVTPDQIPLHGLARLTSNPCWARGEVIVSCCCQDKLASATTC